MYTGHELPNSKPFENQTNDTVQNIGGAYKGWGEAHKFGVSYWKGKDKARWDRVRIFKLRLSATYVQYGYAYSKE